MECGIQHNKSHRWQNYSLFVMKNPTEYAKFWTDKLTLNTKYFQNIQKVDKIDRKISFFLQPCEIRFSGAQKMAANIAISVRNAHWLRGTLSVLVTKKRAQSPHFLLPNCN